MTDNPKTTTIMGCVDCLMAVANNEVPDDTERQLAILDGFLSILRDGYRVSVGDTDNDTDFSKVPCELCRSPLHGSRHELVLELK